MLWQVVGTVQHAWQSSELHATAAELAHSVLARLPTMSDETDVCVRTALPASPLTSRQDANGLSYYQFEFTIEGPKFKRHNVAVLATQVGVPLSILLHRGCRL